MTAQPADLSQIKSGMAVLTACVVQTLNESDRTAQERFLKRIERAYLEFRDHRPGDNQHVLEMISWTRELLTGFNLITGQGKPFLKD